ncbi:hypothetical protein [Leifsonia xyli]
MVEVDIRDALPDDLSAVGGLRWDSLVEQGGEPHATRDSFATAFGE